VRVPDGLKLRVGLLEVRRSLGVCSITKARLLVPTYVARVKEVFQMATMIELSKGDIQSLIRGCFTDMALEAEKFVPDSPQHAEYHDHCCSERLLVLRHQIKYGTPGPDVNAAARRMLQAHGYNEENLCPASRRDIDVGMARAEAEVQRLSIFRLEERLLSYTPEDQLFRNCPALTNATKLPSTDAPKTCAPTGPTLEATCQHYLGANKKKWRPKTHAMYAQRLGYLVEHFGAETPVTSISTADMRGYRDAVSKLRTMHHLGAGKSFIERQTEVEGMRISPKTASIVLETAKGFLKWAKSDGYILENPGDGLQIVLPKVSKADKPRRPFSGDELKILFSAPVFAGCKSVRRRFDAGSLKLRDAYFWIPILAYLTGARLGEIVQLHVADLDVDGPIPYLHITDAGSGELGTGDEKHVKSAAGVRKVPLHPDLLGLGFLEFVRKRKADKRASKRLFYEVAYGKDHQASTVFSKWFARLMDKVGLADPALVFHSFRHTAEDAFRNALQHQYVTDRIIGHNDGSTSSGYGDGVSLEVADKAVRAMVLPFNVADFLTSPAPS
jgi:integrase